MNGGGAGYKNGFFRNMLTVDKDANVRFLDILNAMCGTDLTIENTSIEDVSLDNVFYTKLRNDVAKIVNGRLVVLIEHQSTINENMPLRMLEYVAETYANILNVRDRYKERLQKIPRPVFAVFYNGTAGFPAEKTLRLSDAFMNAGTDEVMLELYVRVININLNTNPGILQKSSVLYDYSALCANIEQCKKEKKQDYVRAGILRTIDSGILVEYLKRNITEAAGMLRAEYDYDLDMAVKSEESYDLGISQGISQGEERKARSAARALLAEHIPTDTIARCTGLTEDEVRALA